MQYPQEQMLLEAVAEAEEAEVVVAPVGVACKQAPAEVAEKVEARVEVVAPVRVVVEQFQPQLLKKERGLHQPRN